jgi:hypothetical protein
MGGEITETRILIQLAHHEQAAVGGARDPWKSTFGEVLKER